MRHLKRVLLALAILILFGAAWVRWMRPVRVDMAGYVPADSIIYLEANDLPAIVGALTSTDAWRALAPQNGVTNDFGNYVRVGRLSAYTGLGSSEWVVLSRAQLAVTVLGFDAAERPDGILKLSPRVAVVAETHSSERRALAAVEKLVGDFARRLYGSTSLEKREVDGIQFLTWSDPSGSRRGIVAAIDGSVAVIGNDESSVRACLGVRRGERPSLATNEQMKSMRQRIRTDDSLAFGFAPAGSPAKIVEVFAPAFVLEVSPEPYIQSLLASFLPQMINRVVGEIGWNARRAEGAVEDHFFVVLPDNLAQRLQTPFKPSTSSANSAMSLLPADTYEVSRYTFSDAAVAWRGLNAGISSQVSIIEATSINRALEALLKPYGIDSPREFFPATGSELVTARLNAASDGKVILASVRNRDALWRQVSEIVGSNPRVENVGGEKMLVSAGEDGMAAAFAGDFLVLGPSHDVRRCLESRNANQTLATRPDPPLVPSSLFSDQPFLVTATDEDRVAQAVVRYAGGKKSAQTGGSENRGASPQLYRLSQTRLSGEGLERRTRSAFGLFGDVVGRFADAESNGVAER